MVFIYKGYLKLFGYTRETINEMVREKWTSSVFRIYRRVPEQQYWQKPSQPIPGRPVPLSESLRIVAGAVK